MRFAKAGLSLLCVLSLAACATAVQPKDQAIQITAIHGDDPKCILETPLNRYQAFPPQAVNVERSRYVLVVDCTANGGKHRRLLIPPEHNPTSSYFQGPLIIFDKITGSAWQYPPYIRVDFDYEPFVDPMHPDGGAPETAQGVSGVKAERYAPRPLNN